MKIILAGGSGFIGSALIDALIARGDTVVLLTRDDAQAGARWGGKVQAKLWNGADPGPWVMALDGADAVVNLAGENIAGGRWTPERKLSLVKSRLQTTRALVAAITAAKRRPIVFLNASAVGYYGGAAFQDTPESSAQGSDFLAALCGQWEREATAAEKCGVRTLILRIGIVLDKDGGALAKMLLPFSLGVGGRLGSGKQPFPWIHRDDVVGIIIAGITDSRLAGPINVTAPEMKTNAEFSAALGRAMHRPALLPAPGFALKIALGEMAEMLLGGQRALPKKLLDASYRFKYPLLDKALESIFK